MAGLSVQVPRLVKISMAMLMGTIASVALLAQLPGAFAAPAANAAPTPAPSPTGCNALLFNGQWYCSATIAGVKAASYGSGKRVVLKSVTVTARSSSSVTVGAWVSQPCPPDKFCGATLTLETLTVSWTGTARPAHGDVINLFGTTTSQSLTPTGYVKIGYCPIEWC